MAPPPLVGAARKGTRSDGRADGPINGE